MGGYAKYIATREGVEKIDDSQRHAPATIKQQELIMRILRDFPDAKESHEYEDYRREKTVGNASEFITRALEENMDRVADSKTYADYIATRPRAERFGSHGLFTDDGVQVQLSKVSQELNEYTGHVYTTILSLRREDAARLGFDNGSRWRDFLRGQTQTISENLKIPMEHLRWYAAYHDEGHHPHIHMIAYSTVPGEGYLSDKGVETMRSTFARDIFKQDMHQIYAQQAQFRDQLREQGRESVAEIVAQINSGVYSNTKVEALLVSLSDRLSRTSGKKVYGYLKADVKAIVDEIVAELAADERIRKLYDLWYEQREDVLRTYTDHFPERVPLEQNKEFKTIRNAVIQEAMKIVSGIQQAAELEPQQDVWEVDLPSGEEPDMEAMADPSYWTAQFQPKFTEVEPVISETDPVDVEPEDAPTLRSSNSKEWWSDYYKLARKYLYGTKERKIRHIHKRSTAAQGGFKGNAPGSEPEYSFHWHGGGDVLYLFEAPIDMLSFISMFKHCWKSQSYAASCGVSDKVLWQMLKDGPHIKKVYICFDNDKPGQQAAQRISREMTEKNIWHEIYPPENKDWNEDLLKWRKGQV